ncbi:MAG: hypothetical protein Q8O13_10670 [Candidatus Omnitrophota bacterium]|nr:hypothetical protein [Candidatus Omnitrophota bacterium]
MQGRIFIIGNVIGGSLIVISFVSTIFRVKVFNFYGLSLGSFGSIIIGITLLLYYYIGTKTEKIFKNWVWNIWGFFALALGLKDLLPFDRTKMNIILAIFLVIALFYKRRRLQKKMG